MDWNKEEAIRAKGIAQGKMENKDFVGARRIALKAQRLNAELENIAQMLVVCEVHCVADQNSLGDELDWYGILNVEPTADEAMIKKQYRKLALQLHPDKNNFPGAEAAFKLIGEAQRVLLDKGKRSLHDMKRKASAPQAVPPSQLQKGATHSTNSRVPNNFGGNVGGVNPQNPKPQQRATGQGFTNGRPTFWTMCPSCSVKYLYVIEAMNKSLPCKACCKNFIACPTNAQGAPPASNSNQTATPARKNASNQGRMHQFPKHSGAEFTQKKGTQPEKVSQKVTGKRRRNQEEESSKRCNNVRVNDGKEGTSINMDGDFYAEANVEYAGKHPRRSARRKQQVSCEENMNDGVDCSMKQSEEVKGGGVSCADKKTVNGLKEESPNIKERSGSAMEGKREEENGSRQHSVVTEIDISQSSSSMSESEPELVECPDPEFNNFDGVRHESCFSRGQMWAIYDTIDAMPRFYARIDKVFSPGFKLLITWLEPDPDDESQREWVEEDLPVACGKFKHGESETTEDRLMFSHLVQWEKGSRRSTYKIYPRKGETWALFKNWDKMKRPDTANKKYEYEFVEILSEYDEVTGARVAPLVKVSGFTSLFRRARENGESAFQVPSNELFRFANRVPSFKMTGEEKAGVPKGCFELDPACLF